MNNTKLLPPISELTIAIENTRIYSEIKRMHNANEKVTERNNDKMWNRMNQVTAFFGFAYILDEEVAAMIHYDLEEIPYSNTAIGELIAKLKFYP